MKLITAIVRPEKLDAIREGLEAYGVQGLTVSAASGYGRQRGYTEVYRGAEYNVDLLPKIRVEVLATDEQADDILDVIIASSNTGRAGDGKVWTMDVFEAVGSAPGNVVRQPSRPRFLRVSPKPGCFGHPHVAAGQPGAHSSAWWGASQSRDEPVGTRCSPLAVVTWRVRPVEVPKNGPVCGLGTEPR